MESRKLVFVRVAKQAGARSPASPSPAPPTAPSSASRPPAGLDEAPGRWEKRTGAKRHPAFGALKGASWVEPGWDLTAPAMPEWPDMIDAIYGEEKR